MEKKIIKSFNFSHTLNDDNKNSQNLSSDKNLINVKLPNLQTTLKKKNVKAKIKTQMSMKLDSQDLERKSIINDSDYSLNNSINSKKEEHYKSNSNTNLSITKNNEDYFPILYKKKKTRNMILQKDDSKNYFYKNSNSNNSRIKKKNRTIINIYNTSVKNSQKIYLLSSLLSSSTTLPTSSNNNNKSGKRINNLLKDNKKMYLPSMDYVRTHHRNRKKNKTPKNTLKKKLKMNIKGNEYFNHFREKKNLSYLKHNNNKNTNETIKNNKNYKDGPDYNEEIRNKFIKKYSKDEKNEFEIFKRKNNLISNILEEKKIIIKRINIENKKEKKEELPIISILHNYFLHIFNLKNLKYLKKFESNILIKNVNKTKYMLINKIHDSIPSILLTKYFEFDIYSYISNRDFGFKHLLKNIKFNSYESIRSLEKLRNDLKHQENFYFLLERFIKNDLLIECDEKIITFNLKQHFIPIQKEKRISVFKINNSNKKKIKRKYSFYNKIKIPHTILTGNYFQRKKDKVYIDRRVSIIRRLKFNLSKETYKLKKNKKYRNSIINGNMTKENMVFKTQEIKNKIKKDLKTLEEILFFLIKENNFREFKDIQKRFQISLESKNNTKDTFLIYASKCEKIDFVEYLIEKGAFINAQNNELNTPLHYALKNKNFKISDLLLKAGANEKLVNKNNLTPWQFMNNNQM